MIRVDLMWVNNLSSSIKDAQIELEIKGEAYDQRSVSVTKGAYRSYDNKAVWNSASLKDLASVAPGSSGKAQLGFSIKILCLFTNRETRIFPSAWKRK